MRPSLRDSEGALHERGDLLLEDGDDLLGELLAHVRGDELQPELGALLRDLHQGIGLLELRLHEPPPRLLQLLLQGGVRVEARADVALHLVLEEVADGVEDEVLGVQDAAGLLEQALDDVVLGHGADKGRGALRLAVGGFAPSGSGLSCPGGTYSVVPGAGSWGPLADPWQCPVQRYTCPGVPGRVRTSRRCDGATTRGPPPTAPKVHLLRCNCPGTGSQSAEALQGRAVLLDPPVEGGARPRVLLQEEPERPLARAGLPRTAGIDLHLARPAPIVVPPVDVPSSPDLPDLEPAPRLHPVTPT